MDMMKSDDQEHGLKALHAATMKVLFSMFDTREEAAAFAESVS